MRKISLHRLLSRLTVLALAASPAAATAAASPAVQLAADEDELDASLPIDREHVDPHDAVAMLGRNLALALVEMRPIAATQLAATWALSEEPLRRAAVAHALEWTFRLVGDAVVLDHLSHDTDPAIRGACARAAWLRHHPAVLARLAEDPDPDVRSIASRAG